MLASFQDTLDTSNFPETHPLYSTRNKARLGCFKDETCGQHINSFIALSPKMYSFTTYEDKEKNQCRAKGVKKYKKATLTHEHYFKAYHDQKSIHVKQNMIQSRNHTLKTIIQQKKRALSCWEDKRYWNSPNESFPYGYYRTPDKLPLKKRHWPFAEESC